MMTTQQRDATLADPAPDLPAEEKMQAILMQRAQKLAQPIAQAEDDADSMRVLTLEIGGDFLPQNLGIDKSYHGLSHHGNDEEAINHLIKLETYQIKHFGKFLTRLASIKDGDRTLLDSTAVLFGSGMGNANSHTNSDLPIILAGGGYQHGEYRKVAADGPGKVPLCNLYLEMAHRMGVEIDAFGSSTGTFV